MRGARHGVPGVCSHVKAEFLKAGWAGTLVSTLAEYKHPSVRPWQPSPGSSPWPGLEAWEGQGGRSHMRWCSPGPASPCEDEHPHIHPCSPHPSSPPSVLCTTPAILTLISSPSCFPSLPSSFSEDTDHLHPGLGTCGHSSSHGPWHPVPSSAGRSSLICFPGRTRLGSKLLQSPGGCQPCSTVASRADD